MYLPKILSAHAIKHEIYAKICYEERIENVLHNDCCVLRFRCLRLSKREERNVQMSKRERGGGMLVNGGKCH